MTKNSFKLIPQYSSFPLGFQTASTSLGMRQANKRDLALILSQTNSNSAAVFTKNKFSAAPVKISQGVMHKSPNAILVNSGCANSCTGERGSRDALRCADVVKNYGGYLPILMSTGVIGTYLDVEKIVDAVPGLYGSMGTRHEDWVNTAEAFMTTDTFPKLRVHKDQLSGQQYHILGISKGAGMIRPNMATLLGTFLTDAAIPSHLLHKYLKIAVDKSFNRISVDGDTSTNDTVCVMSSNMVQVSEDSFEEFGQALINICQQMAKLVVRDGVGSTKFITIHVKSAESPEQAEQCARAICSSLPVKTSFHANFANWERIVSALGTVDIKPEKVDVFLKGGDVSVVHDEVEDLENAPNSLHMIHLGEPYEIDHVIAGEILKERDISLVVGLGCEGGYSDTMWTCDISNEYVAINRSAS